MSPLVAGVRRNAGDLLNSGAAFRSMIHCDTKLEVPSKKAGTDGDPANPDAGLELLWIMAISISAVLSFGDDSSPTDLSFALTHRCCSSCEAAARSWAWLMVAGNERSSASRFIAFLFGADDASGLRPLGFERPRDLGGMVAEGEEVTAAARGFGKWREDCKFWRRRR